MKTKQKDIDPEQAWFWTAEWQRGERQADEDIRRGRLSPPLKSPADLKKYLSGQ